jgi:hypothetical protein
MSPTRQTATSPPDVRAVCQDCGWTTTAPNGVGNAARHHDASGHVVHVDVRRTIVYGDPLAPIAGQTTLEEHLTA